MMTRPYYRNANAAVVVCDVTRCVHERALTVIDTYAVLSSYMP